VKRSLNSSDALVSDPGFVRLKDHVIALTGLAYYADKDEDLAARVSRRLAILRIAGCDAYLNLLRDPQRGEVEVDKLIAELTIGETFFFRHREMFDALRDVVLPEVIQRNRASRRLRIWSAGCSIGAEPYTLAILLKQQLAHVLDGWDVSIVGTDINREFLARAREGEYEEWAFRSVPEEIKLSCFTRAGPLWRIAPDFKTCVSFQYHNLVEHPYPSLVQNLFAFDLILCRNVMIYFSQDIIRTIIGRFQHCLVDGGWLLVGHSEPNIETYRAYHTVNATGAVLYQKSSRPPAPPDWPTDATVANQPVFPARQAAAAWTPPDLTAVAEPVATLPAMPVGTAALAPPTTSEPLAPTLPELAEIRALADQGCLEQAASRCAELLAVNKLNPAAHFYQALILEQMGRHEETQQALKRAVYLDRNYVLAHYYLGLTLQRLDQRPGAARSFRNVIGLLTPLDREQQIPDADDLKVGELEKLTQMHLEALKP
jgi:chemotaxis protein methyltransferase CheR